MSLSLTALDWVVCLAALLGSIFIGLWISVRARSGQSSAGFFLAGRTLTWPVVGASLFATNIARCSNDTIHPMCYNYQEYVERAMACSGRKILGVEEINSYAHWTPY